MYSYLLDTNAVSALMRDPGGAVARVVERVGEGAVCTSVVVAAELRYGAEKSGSVRWQERVELILGVLDVLPLEMPADRHYAVVRCALQRAGLPIGPNDLLIAARALALDLTVVTANLREFTRVPDLRVEDWSR